MLHDEIRDVCIRACTYHRNDRVLDSGCHTPLGLWSVPESTHVQEFYDRYFLRFGLPEEDHRTPQVTDIVPLRNIVLDEKGSDAAHGVFRSYLTMVDDISGRMGDVIPTVLNTSYHNGERVLIVVPDSNHAGRLASSIPRQLWNRFRYIRKHDLEVNVFGYMASILEDLERDGNVTPEAICDRLDEVTKDLLAARYDSIVDSIGDLNFVMIEKSDMMKHMSPVEGDGRLYLDFDRILVIGAEEFSIVDTMPLYTFHRPMSFFYGRLPEDMPFLPEDYDVPDSFPITLCSRYSEAMLYETESGMERYLRDMSRPRTWMAVRYEV